MQLQNALLLCLARRKQILPLVKMLSMLYNVFSIYIHLKYRGKKHIADFLVTGKQEQSAGHGCVKDPPGHCSAWVDCMAASIKYHKA
jgi:hypothetical protein